MTTPTPGQVKLTEDQYERIELLIDNAATASQCREMLRDDDGIESGLREAVRMNVAEPLMRELAALRTSSQAGERGNKAGPAHAGFKAPSSGSLPNTAGPVTPATPPAPDTPLQIVNRQAEDEGLWFIAQTAPEAYLQRALRELHAAIERPATQDGEIIALSNALDCYATHEAVPGVAAAMRRAATLLRTLSADLAVARRCHQTVLTLYEAQTDELAQAEQDLAAARQELAKFGPINGNRSDTSLANWFPFSAEQLAAAEARAEKAERERCRHGWRGTVPEDGQRIVTPCPECGSQSLFIGSGGHLTCARVPTDHGDGCPSPSVEATVKRLKGSLSEATRTAEQARATALEYEQDAMRYRFWREVWTRDDDMESMNDLSHDSFNTPEQWDAIIDDALSAQTEEKP